MKHAVLFMILLVFAAVSTHAQDATLTTKTKSAYLGGNGGIFYQGPVQQSDLYLSWANGVWVDIWTSTAFNTAKDFDKEVDVTLGKSGKLSGLAYSADVTYICAVVIDVMSINLQLDKTYQPSNSISITPFIRGEGYLPVRSGGPRKGLMAITGVNGNFSVTPRFGLSFNGKLKKDSGAFAFDSALLGSSNVNLNFAINKRLTAIAGINFSAPLSHVTDGRKKEATWEVGLVCRL